MKKWAINSMIALGTLIWGLVSPVSGATEKIIIWEHIWNQRDAVELLLNHTTKDYGPYKMVKSTKMEQGRAVKSLQKNKLVNLLILPTSQERESLLLPVHIYTGGSLLGYRVCLIPQGTQHKFESIKTLQDWHNTKFRMGTGTHWADTPILEENNLKVVKNSKYEPLYAMLAKQRFECFPRGIDQIDRKMKQFGPQGKGLAIEVEQNLLFVYPFRSIIFVSRENPKLRERLLTGYQRAVQDGSWQKRFAESQEEAEQFEFLKLKDRTVIHLKNPYMTEETLKLKVYDYDPLK